MLEWGRRVKYKKTFCWLKGYKDLYNLFFISSEWRQALPFDPPMNNQSVYGRQSECSIFSSITRSVAPAGLPQWRKPCWMESWVVGEGCGMERDRARLSRANVAPRELKTKNWSSWGVLMSHVLLGWSLDNLDSLVISAGSRWYLSYLGHFFGLASQGALLP